MFEQEKQIIEQAWERRELLAGEDVREAIRRTVAAVDAGELRCAEPVDVERSLWQVNEWVKKAIIMYFPIQPMRTMRGGELEWYDKMELKHDYERLGVRVVPQAVARYGAYIAPGAILMPSYVNIGAWVGTGTMVDTWATVGSCAQIGCGVHLRGVGTRAGRAGNHRGQLLHRLALDSGRGCARMSRGGARVEHGHYRVDAYNRRDGQRAGRVQGLCAAALGGRFRHLHAPLPCRRIRRAVRSYHRTPKGVDRQEDVAQRRSARLPHSLTRQAARDNGEVP